MRTRGRARLLTRRSDGLVAPETPAPPEAIAARACGAVRAPPARPLASPADPPARRRARHRRCDRARHRPGGRITPEDLDAYVAGATAPAPQAADARNARVTEIKIIGLRRKIAEQMQEAKRRIPHFGYVEEFDLTELEALRRDLNADPAPQQPQADACCRSSCGRW